MTVENFTARFQVLQQAPKRERAEMSGSLHADLRALCTEDLCDLVCLCENALEPKAVARAAMKILLRAFEGRQDVRVERLLRGGMTLPTLLQVVQRTECADLPLAPAFADDLLAMLLSWSEGGGSAGYQADGGGAHPSAMILGAVRSLGLAGSLTEATTEALLDQAFMCVGGNGTAETKRGISARQVLEAGELMPSWRPLMLRVLLGGRHAEDKAPLKAAVGLKPRELVRVAQAWGAHEDAVVFARLQELLATRQKPPLRAADGAELPTAAEAAAAAAEDGDSGANGTVCQQVPVLRLGDDEGLILVDGSAEADAVLRLAADAVADAETSVVIGLDAEWEDPRPLSLLQLAVQWRRRRCCHQESTGEETSVQVAAQGGNASGAGDAGVGALEADVNVKVFVVDMLAPLSSATLDCCRVLLRSPCHPAGGNEVLCFGAIEDRRRLAAAGVLPELGVGAVAGGAGVSAGDSAGAAASTAADRLGWEDLQLRGSWGGLDLGPQPSLQTVVRYQLGAHLDKRLQQSNWDSRPLTREQLEYAALDAVALLRLRSAAVAAPAAGGSGGSGNRGDAALRAAHPGVAGASNGDRRITANGKLHDGPAVAAPGALTRDQERKRWQEYRRSRGLGRKAATEARELNSDLRFVLPSCLNRLMRKMRGLGLDTAILPEGLTAKHLAPIAMDEDRIVLTRSRKTQLPGPAAARLYLLRSSDDTDEQLREIIDVFGVEVDVDCLCGRCVQCNTWDWRLTTRDDVRGNPQVNEKTLSLFEEFWTCGGCGKIFWEGGMFEKAVTHFRTFLPPEADGGAVGSCGSDEACVRGGVDASEGASGVGSVGGGADGAGGAPEKLGAVDDAAAKAREARYREMEADGCSEQRIRAQKVRDGVLTPGSLVRPPKSD